MENNNNGGYRLLTILMGLLMLIMLGYIIFDRYAGRVNTISSASGTEWSKLNAILETVSSNYVDPVDQKEVTETILPDIMHQLDPHSIYLPPQDLKAADEELQGGFDGIGIMFTVPNDTAVISTVITGGPSERAGLLTGDRIMRVDTVDIAGVGMPQDSMVRLMRGRRGTKVRVTVLRDGEQVPFDITRDKIPVNSVDVAFMVNDTTAYIKLSKFARTSYYEVLKAALKMRDEGMKRMILDLRDNTGGYMDQALLICNEFLEEGQLVVYMEGAHRQRQDVYADGKGLFKDIGLDILINESSASSSEIVAGAMQDNDRATIYGLRSFGKGVVQEPFYLTDGSGIRLTVARYHTPTGRCIQKPYSDDYELDLIERYRHGEMMSADSIRVNDSLRYETPGGRVVYGGGGIVPDVFIPLDTVGVTDFLVKCNRQSLQVKFANHITDQHRARMRGISRMYDLQQFLSELDLKSLFLYFAAGYDVRPEKGDWEKSGDIILTQVKALIGRYTAMGDEGFYPIWINIDSTVQAAIAGSGAGQPDGQ